MARKSASKKPSRSLVKKKKRALTLRNLSTSEWKIHPFNDLLQREVARLLTKMGLHNEPEEIKYGKGVLLAFDCPPSFILSLKKNDFYKEEDYILFHRKAGTKNPWRIKRF